MAATGLPVLMYHGIHDGTDSPGVFNPRYSVGVEEFARQLDWLSAAGFRTTLLDEPARSPRDVVLTFDDGDASNASVAVPLLAERGMVGEFCITSDHVDRPGMITHQEVRDLVDAGMGVQSHARTHRPLSTLPADELAEELATSKQRLEEWSGGPVLALTLPGGRGGARELRAARAAGYRFVLNSVPGPNRRPRPDGYLRRIAITRGTGPGEFAQLVRWQGLAPVTLAARTTALELVKRVLGDARYGSLRESVSAR